MNTARFRLAHPSTSSSNHIISIVGNENNSEEVPEHYRSGCKGLQAARFMVNMFRVNASFDY
jgi:hypothetical protein